VEGLQRDGIYDFLHFHTGTHGCWASPAARHACSSAASKEGLSPSRRACPRAPAGTGHQRLTASKDLLVVGAYPAGGSYDEPAPGDIDHAKAKKKIARVRKPARDPVYGKNGPLQAVWKRR
jgi:uncharacterized protein YjlB